MIPKPTSRQRGRQKCLLIFSMTIKLCWPMVAWDTASLLHCYGPGTEEISKHLDKDYLDNITVLPYKLARSTDSFREQVDLTLYSLF